MAVIIVRPVDARIEAVLDQRVELDKAVEPAEPVARMPARQWSELPPRRRLPVTSTSEPRGPGDERVMLRRGGSRGAEASRDGVVRGLNGRRLAEREEVDSCD